MIRRVSAGSGGIVAEANRHVGHEVGEHDLLDTGLAERRKHPLDVAQEHPVRPDDEHALVLQREAVGVQQIGGTVQGDDRLAGARSALDDEHAGLRRTDDLVLLRLDRGDDVAERSGTAAFEGGEQRRVPAQPGPRRVIPVEPLVVADAEMSVAEQLVLDAEDRTTLDGEVTTTHQAHRLAARRPVERLGHRRPPVDDDGLGVLVGDRQATDVKALRGAVGLGGAQGCLGLGGAQGCLGLGGAQDGGCSARRSIRPNTSAASPRSSSLSRLIRASSNAFRSKSGLHRAAEVGLVEISQAPRRRFRGFQAVIGEIDIRLLVIQFWVLFGQTFPSKVER